MPDPTLQFIGDIARWYFSNLNYTCPSTLAILGGLGYLWNKNSVQTITYDLTRQTNETNFEYFSRLRQENPNIPPKVLRGMITGVDAANQKTGTTPFQILAESEEAQRKLDATYGPRP